MRSSDRADTNLCGFPRETLIAYRDGTLRAAQLEITQAHIAACTGCQAYLREIDQVDRILQDSIVRVDDREARATIKARIASMPAPTADRARRVPFSRVRLSLAAAVMVGLLVVSIAIPGVIEGGSSFTRFFRRDAEPGRVYPEGFLSGTPIGVPTVSLGAAVLPFSLAPVTPVSVDGSFVEQGFRSPDGLAISVSADHSGEAVVLPPANSTAQRMVTVGETEVLVGLYSDEEWVSDLIWVEDDALYRVLVLEQPPDGLRLHQALELARAVMDDWRPFQDHDRT